MPDGTIHLSRNILRSDVWREMNPNRAKVWITILCLVSPVKQTVRIMGRDFDIKPGEIVAVEQTIADETGLSLQTFRASLKDLAIDDGRISIKRGLKKGRIKIRVLNYERYQTPCIAPEQPEEDPVPKTPSGRKRARQGALAWMDEIRAVASRRARRTAVLIQESGATDETDRTVKARAFRDAAGKAWVGTESWEWLGLYDLKYEQVFSIRSSEILSATKRELMAHIPRIKKMMNVLTSWATARNSTPEGMMFDYIRWRFFMERRKNKRVIEHGGKIRNPIDLADCFDPAMLSKWYASVEVIRT
jgi:hypothetical protein